MKLRELVVRYEVAGFTYFPAVTAGRRTELSSICGTKLSDQKGRAGASWSALLLQSICLHNKTYISDNI